jgi:hypothetical protein
MNDTNGARNEIVTNFNTIYDKLEIQMNQIQELMQLIFEMNSGKQLIPNGGLIARIARNPTKLLKSTSAPTHPYPKTICYPDNLLHPMHPEQLFSKDELDLLLHMCPGTNDMMDGMHYQIRDMLRNVSDLIGEVIAELNVDEPVTNQLTNQFIFRVGNSRKWLNECIPFWSLHVRRYRHRWEC